MSTTAPELPTHEQLANIIAEDKPAPKPTLVPQVFHDAEIDGIEQSDQDQHDLSDLRGELGQESILIPSTEASLEAKKTPREILEVLPPGIREAASWIFESIDAIQDPNYEIPEKLPTPGELDASGTELIGALHDIEMAQYMYGPKFVDIARKFGKLLAIKKVLVQKAQVEKDQAMERANAERDNHEKTVAKAGDEYSEANKGNRFSKWRKRDELDALQLRHLDLQMQGYEYFDSEHDAMIATDAHRFVENILNDPVRTFLDVLIDRDVRSARFNRRDNARAWNVPIKDDDISASIKNALDTNVERFINRVTPGFHTGGREQALKAMSRNALVQVLSQALDAAELPEDLGEKLKKSFSADLSSEIYYDYSDATYLQTALESPEILDYLPLKIPGKDDYLARERYFWKYIVDHNIAIEVGHVFKPLRDNFDRFTDLVKDGKETPELWQILAAKHPKAFMLMAGKDQWRELMGDEALAKFLDALPRATDEKRNAFTHNEYDRTTNFLQTLRGTSEFHLTSEDFEVVTGYIAEFGLSNTPLLYEFYRNIKLFEQGRIDALPQDMVDFGITSADAIKQRIRNLRGSIYSEKEILDVSDISNLDRRFLEYLSGFSTHRFGRNRSLDQIISDFGSNHDSGKIEPTPDGYALDTISVSETRIEFDPKPIQADYEVLRGEILSSIENSGKFEDLRGGVLVTIKAKIDEINTKITGIEGGQKAYMEKAIAELTQYSTQINEVENLDDLVTSLVDMKFDKNELKDIHSVLRQVVFRKIISHQFSPEMVNNLQQILEGEISPEAILGVVNLIDHVAKAHVLDLTKDNQDGYWSKKAFDKLKTSKRGRNLSEIFDQHAQNLRKAVSDFEVIKTGGSDNIKMIPDRGLIGELSGYLADVCYTKEYPLLVKYPNVIPYKFVQGQGTESDFIGSVLVFEVKDHRGNLSLLIRALDIPGEKNIDIATFTEKLLDNLQKVAQKRGAKQVLLSGTNGTISNYQMTTNYVLRNYVNGHNPVPLAERFDFNGYDISNDIYLARTVPEETPQTS